MALGFSPNGGMRGADIAFAWIQESSIILQVSRQQQQQQRQQQQQQKQQDQ